MRSALAGAAGGESSIVLLSGPPGTGKSRLARELGALAAAAGFTVLTGHANEFGQDVPYAPFVEAFGPPLRRGTGADTARLLSGIPQLALLVAGLGTPAPPPLSDPAVERARLMDGFARLAARMAHRQPLALVLDDLQAFDGASAALLRHLTLTVADEPVLLVLTARSDEPGTTRLAPVRRGLQECPWPLLDLPVPALDDGAAALLLNQLIGGEASAELTRAVLRRCGGRPLLLELLARNLVEGRLLRRNRQGPIEVSGGVMPLPESVRDLLDSRLRALGGPERTVARLLAAAGQAEPRVLAEAAGADVPDIVESLDRLERRGLLAGGGPRSYRLAHGLLQETLLAGLTPIGRQRLHAALALALQRRHPHDAQIAEHLVAAGPLAPAGQSVAWLVAGADRARLVGAVPDAIRYTTAALALVDGPDRDADPASLLASLGDLELLAGRRSAAGTHWQQALQLFRGRADPLGTSRLHRKLGMLAWSDGLTGQAAAHLDQAGEALADLEPGPEHAELLHFRTAAAARSGDTAAVRANAAKLRALADSLHSPEYSARACLAEAAADLNAFSLGAAVHKNRQALAFAAGDPELEAGAYDQLSVCACVQGDLAALRRYSTRSLELVRQRGAVTLEPWPRMRLVMADLLSGNWDEALAQAVEVLEIGRKFGEQRGLVSTLSIYSWLLVCRGRLTEARDYLRQARATAGPMLQPGRPAFGGIAAAGASLALAEGRAAEAVALGSQLSDLPSCWYAVPAALVLGEALAASGRQREASALSTQLRGLTGGAGLPGAGAHWIAGLNSTGTAAASHLGCAVAGFGRLGFRFHAARARLALARAALSASTLPPPEALGLASTALEEFTTLGAPLEEQAARQLLRNHGMVPPRGRARRDTGAPLSPRELEVARMVAESASSAEIATALFISPRTVTTHLSHIYERLGVNSRAGLTRYLADAGLLPVARPPGAPAAGGRAGQNT